MIQTYFLVVSTTSKNSFVVYNMILQVENNTTIANINLKVYTTIKIGSGVWFIFNFFLSILVIQIKSETTEPEGAIVILIFSKETPDLKDYGYFDEFDEEKFKNYEQNE